MRVIVGFFSMMCGFLSAAMMLVLIGLAYQVNDTSMINWLWLLGAIAVASWLAYQWATGRLCKWYRHHKQAGTSR